MTWLTSIWPLIAHAGLGVTLIIGCLAAAYFSPVFKKDFLYAALIVGVALFIYGVGVHDEKSKWEAREQAINTKVDNAIDKAKSSTDKDPFDDPRH